MNEQVQVLVASIGLNFKILEIPRRDYWNTKDQALLIPSQHKSRAIHLRD